MPIPHNDEEEEETSGDSEEEIEQIEQDENHQDEESSGDEIVIQKQEKLKNVLGIEVIDFTNNEFFNLDFYLTDRNKRQKTNRWEKCRWWWRWFRSKSETSYYA